MTVWGIHNKEPSVDFLDQNVIAVGYDAPVGDLTGKSREEIREILLVAHPDAKVRTIAAWTGVLDRFANLMVPGDLVAHPYGADSTVAIGRVTGEYRFDAEAETHRHRRDVEWIRTGIPRTDFSTVTLDVLNTAIALFRIQQCRVSRPASR